MQFANRLCLPLVLAAIIFVAPLVITTTSCTKQPNPPTTPGTPVPWKNKLMQQLQILTESNKTATELVQQYHKDGIITTGTAATIQEYNARIANFAKSSIDIVGSQSTDTTRAVGVRALLEKVVLPDALATQIKAYPAGVQSAIMAIQGLVEVIRAMLQPDQTFGTSPLGEMYLQPWDSVSRTGYRETAFVREVRQ